MLITISIRANPSFVAQKQPWNTVDQLLRLGTHAVEKLKPTSYLRISQTSQIKQNRGGLFISAPRTIHGIPFYSSRTLVNRQTSALQGKGSD